MCRPSTGLSFQPASSSTEEEHHATIYICCEDPKLIALFAKVQIRCSCRLMVVVVVVAVVVKVHHLLLMMVAAMVVAVVVEVEMKVHHLLLMVAVVVEVVVEHLLMVVVLDVLMVATLVNLTTKVHPKKVHPMKVCYTPSLAFSETLCFCSSFVPVSHELFPWHHSQGSFHLYHRISASSSLASHPIWPTGRD